VGRSVGQSCPSEEPMNEKEKAGKLIEDRTGRGQETAIR
jgi:hypothetical protein